MTSSSTLSHFLAKLATRLTILVLLALWLIALMIRLTIQDQTVLSGLFFYAMPPLMLMISGLCLALSLYRIRWRLEAFSLLIAALLAGQPAWSDLLYVSFHETSNRKRPQFDPFEPEVPKTHTQSPKSIRLMFWNLGRGKAGIINLTKEIKRYDADIIGMVEGLEADEQPREFWLSEFPGYDFTQMGGRFHLLSRFPVTDCTPGRFKNMAHYRRVDVTIGNQVHGLLLVDFYSSPRFSRQASLHALAEYVKEDPLQTMFIMGDFNTPDDSRHYEPLRQLIPHHAYEQNGFGPHATWPIPLPLMCLDQIWLKGFSAEQNLGTWHSTSPLSDHRNVVVDLKLDSDQNAAPDLVTQSR